MEFERIKKEIQYLENLAITDNQTNSDRELINELYQVLRLIQSNSQ